jgi:serine/threonine-protein kinase HipA
MNCLGCFKPKEYPYCSKCKKLLFNQQKVSYLLDFDKKAFLSKSVEFSTQLSISGVQDKISLKIEEGKLVPTANDGHYILKPIPLMEYGELIEDVAKNEHFTMQLASQVFGLETASNCLIAFSDGELAYMTKRFDRMEGRKIHQEDFCSLAGQTKDTHGKNYKYDYSYEQIGELIKKYLPTYKIELLKYFKLVLFNYLVGNGDAHLKNFSVTQRPSKEYGLSPAYDLLSSSIHLPYESRMALELFEEYESKSFEANGFYAYDDFMDFAERLGINQKIAQHIIKDFLSKKEKTIALLKQSFLSQEAQQRYETLFLDRVQAVGYQFEREK